MRLVLTCQYRTSRSQYRTSRSQYRTSRSQHGISDSRCRTSHSRVIGGEGHLGRALVANGLGVEGAGSKLIHPTLCEYRTWRSKRVGCYLGRTDAPPQRLVRSSECFGVLGDENLVGAYRTSVPEIA
eukprot:1964138-Rhodomonas_salina.1